MLSASPPSGQSRIRRQRPTLRVSFGYVLPRDFMYLPDFRSPMREAFFLTASVGRPSRDATSAVARLGKRCRSCLMSSFDQTPLTSFFLAISRLLSAYLTHYGLDMQFRILAASHGTIKYFSRFGRKNIAVRPGVVTACTARPWGRFGYCHAMVVPRRAAASESIGRSIVVLRSPSMPNMAIGPDRSRRAHWPAGRPDRCDSAVCLAELSVSMLKRSCVRSRPTCPPLSRAAGP